MTDTVYRITYRDLTAFQIKAFCLMKEAPEREQIIMGALLMHNGYDMDVVCECTDLEYAVVERLEDWVDNNQDSELLVRFDSEEFLRASR